MNRFAIRVDGVSKQYRVGARRERYQLLRDRIAQIARMPFRRSSQRSGATLSQGTFLALDDVGFEVAPSEVVGVIGRNGAGKSTLLKILSRITEPTSGRIDIAGRVGSLLEVGTGFHPELTGRENIYLNGAVLGMRRRETERKLDEIIAFAEVERFVDTPVKHYSSGMYLRLAFSVAAHLEPEILLVDEVLAVGDIAFQRKCLGKMDSVAQQGRTVLFVSHNLAAIKDLCASCVVLDSGKVGFRGPVLQGLAHYTKTISHDTGLRTPGRTGWSHVVVERPDHCGDWLASGEPFTAQARLRLESPLEAGRLYCLLNASSGDCVVHNYIEVSGHAMPPLAPGEYLLRATFPPLWLVPDAYTFHFKLHGRDDKQQNVRVLSDRVMIDVRDTRGQTNGKVRATLIPPVEWIIDPCGGSCETNSAR